MKKEWEKLAQLGDQAKESIKELLKTKGVHHEWAESLLKIIGSDVEFLIDALKVRSIRISAAKALGEIGDSRAVEPLISLFKELDYYIDGKDIIAEVLGKMQDERAIDPLMEVVLYASRDYEERCAAVRAVGRIGSPRPVKLLMQVLFNEKKYLTDPDLNESIISVLRYMAVPSSIPPLIKKLHNSKKPDHRVRAAKVLGGIDDIDALNALKKALSEDDNLNVKMVIESALS